MICHIIDLGCNKYWPSLQWQYCLQSGQYVSVQYVCVCYTAPAVNICFVYTNWVNLLMLLIITYISVICWTQIQFVCNITFFLPLDSATYWLVLWHTCANGTSIFTYCFCIFHSDFYIFHTGCKCSPDVAAAERCQCGPNCKCDAKCVGGQCKCGPYGKHIIFILWFANKRVLDAVYKHIAFIH